MYIFISIFLLFAFIGNQVFRLDINSVGITLLDISVGIVSSGWLLLHIKSLRNIIWDDKIGRAWIYFILAALFSLSINSGYLSSSEFWVAFLYLLRWIFYSLLFFIVKHSNKYNKLFTVQLLTISGVAIVVFGYVQYFLYPSLKNLFYLGWDEHMYRLFSVFLDPNFAGAFLALFIVYLTTQLLREPDLLDIRTHIIQKCILVFATIALLLTFSRSAIIMFVSSLFMLFILENRKKLIVPVIIGIGVFILSVSQFFYLENINLFRTASSNQRLHTAANAIKVIQSQPVFGVGFNAFRYAQRRLGLLNENPKIISHADAGTDNSWLFILATTGIVGTGFFLSFWYELFMYLIEQKKIKIHYLPTVALVSIIGIFVNSMFINSLFYPSILLWIWVVVGISDYK